eukprot:7021552-Prymnesium_polylepis.1
MARVGALAGAGGRSGRGRRYRRGGASRAGLRRGWSEGMLNEYARLYLVPVSLRVQSLRVQRHLCVKRPASRSMKAATSPGSCRGGKRAPTRSNA